MLERTPYPNGLLAWSDCDAGLGRLRGNVDTTTSPRATRDAMVHAAGLKTLKMLLYSLPFMAAVFCCCVIVSALRLHQKVGKGKDNFSWMDIILPLIITQVFSGLLQLVPGIFNLCAGITPEGARSIASAVHTFCCAVALGLLERKLEDDSVGSIIGWVLVPIWSVIIFSILTLTMFPAPEQGEDGPEARPACTFGALSNATAKKLYTFLAYWTVGKKLDGDDTVNWKVTLWPFWMGCVVMFMLVIGAQVFMAKLATPERRHAFMRNLFVMLLLVYAVQYTMLVSMVGKRLDGNMDIKTDDITMSVLTVAILGQVVLAIFLYGAICVAAPMFLRQLTGETEEERQLRVLAAMIEHARANVLAVSEDVQAEVVETRSKVALVRQSSAVFTRMGPLSLPAPSMTDLNALRRNNSRTTPRAQISSSSADVEAPAVPAQGTADAPTQTCAICMENQENAVFMPCGHGGFCHSCAHKVLSTVGRNKCPLCRAAVQEVVTYDPDTPPQLNADGHEVITSTTVATVAPAPEGGRQPGGWADGLPPDVTFRPE